MVASGARAWLHSVVNAISVALGVDGVAGERERRRGGRGGRREGVRRRGEQGAHSSDQRKTGSHGSVYASPQFPLVVGAAVLLLLVAFASSIAILPVAVRVGVYVTANYGSCKRWFSMLWVGAFASCSCRMGYYMRLLGLLRDLTYAGRGPMPQATHRSSRVVISSMAALVLGFLLGPLRLHSFATTRVLTALRCVW